jgi:hypothetical protein
MNQWNEQTYAGASKGWLTGEAKARWMRVAVKHCAPVVSSDSKSQTSIAGDNWIRIECRLLVADGMDGGDG